MSAITMPLPTRISLESYSTWLNAMRGQIAALGTTHGAVNEYVGLQRGYLSKILSPRPLKNAGGPILLWLSQALGFRVVLESDEVLLAEASKRLPAIRD